MERQKVEAIKLAISFKKNHLRQAEKLSELYFFHEIRVFASTFIKKRLFIEFLNPEIFQKPL